MRSGIALMASGRRNAAKPNLAPMRPKRRLASMFFAVSAFSSEAKGWNLSPTVFVLQDGFDAALSTDERHLEGNPRLARRYPYNSFISKDERTTVNQNVSAGLFAICTADLEHRALQAWLIDEKSRYSSKLSRGQDPNQVGLVVTRSQRNCSLTEES